MLFLTLLLYSNRYIENHFQFCYKWNEKECIQCKKDYWLFNGKCFLKDLDISKEKEGKISPFFNIRPITINEIQIKLINSKNFAIKNSLSIQQSIFSTQKTSKDTYSGSLGPDSNFSYIDGVLTIEGIGDINAYYLDPHPWKSYEKSIKTLIILDGITSIGCFCFKGCTAMKSVTLPESLIQISAYAFDGCEGLTSFHIPSGVTEFSADSLDYCTNIQSITVDTKNGFFQSINGIIFSKDGSTIVCYPPSKTGKLYKIPDCVTIIGSQAFDRCKELTSIQIPDGVTLIGIRSFYCTKLASVTIPNSVKRIGYSAFYGCFELEYVDMSSGLDSIGELAFCCCSKLAAFNFYGNKNPSYESNSFLGCSLLDCVNVPSSFVDSKFCGFTVNKILVSHQSSSNFIFRPPLTRYLLASSTRKPNIELLIHPPTRSPLAPSIREFNIPIPPTKLLPTTIPPESTIIPQSTKPLPTKIPPQSTNIPQLTKLLPIREFYLPIPPTRSPPMPPPASTIPPQSTKPLPTNELNIQISPQIPPESTILPQSTIPPESTIPPRSTKPLPTNELNIQISPQIPPESTRVPQSTIPPESTKPPQSTKPLPTNELNIQISPQMPPASTIPPQSTKPLPTNELNIQISPQIPPQSTKPLPTNELNIQISPQMPPASTILPQSTIPPESTIPPQSTKPLPTNELNIQISPQIPPASTCVPQSTIPPQSTKLPPTASISFQIQLPIDTSSFLKSHPSKYSQSNEFTQFIITALETSNNYFQNTPSFAKSKDSNGIINIKIIIGICVGIAILLLILILVFYIKRHKSLLNNQKIVFNDEISDDLNFGL